MEKCSCIFHIHHIPVAWRSKRKYPVCERGNWHSINSRGSGKFIKYLVQPVTITPEEYDILTSLLSCIIAMLAKITSKNHLTLPKSVVNSVGNCQ